MSARRIAAAPAPALTPVGASFHLNPPAEPPPYSVVVDSHGLAWQHLAGQWVRNAAVILLFSRIEGAQSWSQLLLDHGPVKLIYTPDAPAESAKSDVQKLNDASKAVSS